VNARSRLAAVAVEQGWPVLRVAVARRRGRVEQTRRA
jgi:hypothetical protein